MDFIIEDLIGPTNPDDYVGRNIVIDAYGELLTNTLRKNTKVKWVHISGTAGVGKSSLLRKLRMMTEQHRIATGSVDVPFSPKFVAQFLTDIKQIIDEIAPEWRGFMRKRRNPEIIKVLSPPELRGEKVTDVIMNDMLELFLEDLDEVNTKMVESQFRNAIFLDDLDRLLVTETKSAIQIIPRIMKKISELDYNLLFVTTSHFTADKYLDLDEAIDENYVLHFSLNQFNFKDAELLLRRKGKLVKSQREDVVHSSTRVPFDLMLRQLIQLKELDPMNLTAKIITEAFGLTDDEVALLREIAKSSVNYYENKDFKKIHNAETIGNLSNALLITQSQDGYFIIDSYAMWELIAHVFKPIDPRTEAILIINRLRDQAEISQLPSSRDIDILEEHFTSIQDHSLIFELSGQLADTAKAALDGKLVQTAWNLLKLATIGLERTKDNEKIADLQESLAKGFAKAGQDYFAAKSYEKAAKYYRNADIEWKSVTNYREAGQRYVKEAEKTNLKIYHYAVRSMLHHAVKSYVHANESKKALEVVEEALELFKEYEIHQNFFNTLEITR